MAETNILSISLKEYKQEIDDLKGSLLGLQKGSKEYEEVLNEVRDRQNKLNEVMADSKKSSDASANSINYFKEQLKVMKKEAENLDVGSPRFKELSKQISETTEKLNEAVAESKRGSEIAANSMNALKAQLKAMKQEAGNLDVGSPRFKELTIQINETTEKLKDLEAQQGTFSRNVGNYESGVVSLKAQLKEMTAQMAQMLKDGVAPTDEAFVELAKKAGDLKDAMADSQQIISHYADDTKSLTTLIDLAKTGTAAYGAFKGALSLFGVENETVNQTMATMTTIMATLNSLQTLQTALVDSASITYRAYHGVLDICGKALAFLGLTSRQTAASTVAETTATAAHTTAMVADTAATGAATVATNLFKKALIATGIGAIIVLIGTFIANLEDLAKGFKNIAALFAQFGMWIGKTTGLIKEQTKAERDAAIAAQNEAAALKRRLEIEKVYSDKQKELTENNGKLMASFIQLKGVWDSLSSVQERTQFIEKYKNEMSSLGIEINNVNDAERVFSTEGLKAFAKSIEMRARLTIIQEKLNQKLREMMELEAGAAKGTHGKSALGRQLQEEIDDLTNQAVELTKMIDEVMPKTSHSTKKTTTKKEHKEDVSGEMEKFERSLDEQIAAIEYAYDLLAAKGEATVKDEIEKVTAIYIATTDMIEKEIEDRQKQLENTKITAEQRKQIQDEIYDLEQERIEADREYTVESEKLKVKARKEALNEITEATKKATEEENKAYAKSNIGRIYIDMLKDVEPEAAATIVSMLSVDDATKEEILSSLEALNGSKIEKQTEYYLSEEQAEYEHQQRLIQIQKDALNEMAINLGQDSEEYLAQKAIVDKMEEDATEAHYRKLAKIQDKHVKDTKKKNRQTMNAFLDMGDSIGNIFSTVGDIMEEDIRNKQENGKISEEEAKKQFETVKNMQIAAATVNMLSGAIGAYMQATQTYPPPYGPILGGINAALATAMGIAQIAQIKNQQYGSSGSASSATGGAATREAVNVDFSSVSVNPLLDEQADINRLTTLSESQQTDQRVYILQSDIADSQKQVQVRQSNTTF